MFNDAPAILNNIELFLVLSFWRGLPLGNLPTWRLDEKFAVMSLVKVELPQNQFCHHLGMVRKSLIPNLLMLRWIKISCINMHQSSEELTSIKCSNTESMFDFPAVFCPGKYITIASYYHPYPEKVYHLAREALLQGGPIPAYLYADSGFMAYGGGIYTHGCDSSANHGHYGGGLRPGLLELLLGRRMRRTPR